jgi:hypothetical protein
MGEPSVFAGPLRQIEGPSAPRESPWSGSGPARGDDQDLRELFYHVRARRFRIALRMTSRSVINLEAVDVANSIAYDDGAAISRQGSRQGRAFQYCHGSAEPLWDIPEPECAVV